MMDSSLEIRGTDTPPEKVPRQFFPATFQENENNGGSSLFSSIMHKFVKIDDREKSTERCLTLFLFYFIYLGFYLDDAYLID
jgi:DNA mismatch repair protein MSH6